MKMALAIKTLTYKTVHFGRWVRLRMTCEFY